MRIQWRPLGLIQESAEGTALGRVEEVYFKGGGFPGGLAFLQECGWPRLGVGCAGGEQDPKWHPEGDV